MIKQVFWSYANVFTLCCTVAMVIYGCSSDHEGSDDKHCRHISRPALPIRLSPDTTLVHLDDFFVDTPSSAVVIFEGDTLRVDANTRTVAIVRQPNDAVSSLRVLVDDCTYDLPVFKSEKVMHRFTFTPDRLFSNVALAGSLNGWNPKATPLVYDGEEWSVDLLLSPAEYEYQIVADGAWITDANNPVIRSNGQGGSNSVLVIGEPTLARPYIRAERDESLSLMISGTSGATVYLWWENHLTGVTSLEAAQRTGTLVQLPAEAKLPARSHLRAFVTSNGVRGNDLIVPLSYGEPITDPTLLDRTDLHALNMYFIMTDRFFDGDTTNNHAVDDADILPVANHHGGDFEGILHQLERGYFDALHINTLWVSPITTNADGAWGLWENGVRSRFSGYHGYWPVRLREVDRNFGDSAVFARLISALHARNKNLLVDYVANHVHQDHPVIAAHPDWVTPLYLPDGSMNTERWDEHRLTTWFDTHLPTLDLERLEVTEAMTDTAMYWVTHFAIDGFRHDATKHIPELFWRTLTRKIKRHVGTSNPERQVFQIGETYGNPELISSYITSGMLDAQFDFNLYDAAVDALARKGSGFINLGRVLNESLLAYGHHHLMGNISGNQDRARFISYADGSVRFDEDAKLAGWTRTITNQGGDSHDRLLMLHALNLTVPGVPCLYYGDEIGLPGGNDPDNRRMMRFDSLTADQRHVRDLFSQLSGLRSSRLSLMYGSTELRQANDTLFELERHYLGERTRLVLSMGGVIALPDGWHLLSSNGVATGSSVRFDMPGYMVMGQ